MRRNASTVVVLAGPVPAKILAAVDRSMNVNLIRPAAPADPARPAAPRRPGRARRPRPPTATGSRRPPGR